MLAVKSIEVVQIDGDRLEFAQRHDITTTTVFDVKGKPCKMDISEAFEAIEGRRFFNDQGKEFCIGMSKQVQDAIGLPFEVFDNMFRQRENDIKEKAKLYIETVDLTILLNQYKEAGFWKRLKYLLKWDELNSPIIWPKADQWDKEEIDTLKALKSPPLELNKIDGGK